MRFARTTLPCLLSLLLTLPAAALAAKPHQHGVATMDIVMDGTTLSIDFETPLDNLLGYERAPRTDAERRAADAAVAKLKAADTLFTIDPAAQCTLDSAALNSAALKLGKTDAPSKADDGHADLDAAYRFSCKGPAPAFVEVGLFGEFKRMKRIEVQIATAKGQSKLSLRAPNKRVTLAR